MGMFDAPGEVINKPDVEEKDKDVEGFETDVEGVMANDVIKNGSDEFPVFDCSPDEFYQNMQNGRKRIRFKQGSAASEYMGKTQYKRAFFIRTTDAAGKVYTRKIK